MPIQGISLAGDQVIFVKMSDVFRQEVRGVCLTSAEVSTLIDRSKHVDRSK